MEAEIEVGVDPSDENFLDKTLSASFNDETEPLMPILDFRISSYVGNKSEMDFQKEELKSRLAGSLKKLEDAERAVNSTWSLVYDSSSIHDNVESRRGEELPRHIEDNVKGVILSAEEYLAKLDEQLRLLDTADEQVRFFIFMFICFLINHKAPLFSWKQN